MRKSKLRLMKRIEFLENRAEKALRRLRRVRERSKGNKVSSSIVLSRTLQYLKDIGFAKCISGYYGKRSIVPIPKAFSFLDNADLAIETLRHLFFCGVNMRCRELIFDHSKCNRLGMCASTVMDVIALEILSARRTVNKSFRYCGVKQSSGDVSDILDVSGLLKHLGFPEPSRSYIEKLDLLKSRESDIVGTKVGEYFLRCLEREGFTLNEDGKAKMGEMVGEVSNNSKIHSGTYGRWYAQGHYTRPVGREYGECHLVFFNFGNTIYEGLKNKDTSPEILRDLRNMSQRHRHKHLFSPFWTEEALWTLYSLQDGVSRLRSKEHPDRGSGTIKLIESFLSIGKNKDGDRPEMSITSGKVHIYFDGTYSLKPEKFKGGVRQIIAFNKSNSLFQPPNSKYVHLLKNSFPGTVISMRFYLDKHYLSQYVANGGISCESRSK